MKRSSKSETGGADLQKMREKVVREEKPPEKKQVRRRLHTRKPYQEKLLNMAEARREIVTALKLHRASMTQKAPPPSPQHNFYNNNNSYFWAAAPPLPPPPPIFEGNDDFVLPDQTLGLNLNLDDFIATPSSSIYSTPSPPPPAAAAGADAVEGFECGGESVRSPFDEVMEFPWWLNACEEQRVTDFSYFHDPAPLPCMQDIEEIEGMDGDWLA